MVVKVLTATWDDIGGLDKLKLDFRRHIIGATNRPDQLDSTLLPPDCLDQLIYILLPGKPSCLSILQATLRKSPMSPNINLNWNLLHTSDSLCMSETVGNPSVWSNVIINQFVMTCFNLDVSARHIIVLTIRSHFPHHAKACEKRLNATQAARHWKPMHGQNKQLGYTQYSEINIADVFNVSRVAVAEQQDSTTNNLRPHQDLMNELGHLEIDDDRISVESEDKSSSGDSNDNADLTAALQSYPGTSTTFLEIKHHPHTGLEPEFIFHDLPVIIQDSENNSDASHSDPGKPWAPFCTRADFEFAEITVQAAMHGNTIKRLLHGIKND
ncbi:hypothetical protein K439DRAFT_1624846 [Ramaria rubella]|nr:hypothetical protein K439DRAFT_1624846 [Ramaria rubella]